MTYPIAWTTSLLAWSLMSNQAAYAKAGQTAATLTQLEWGARYLLKTVYNDTASGTSIVYQARHRSLCVSGRGHDMTTTWQGRQRRTTPAAALLSRNEQYAARDWMQCWLQTCRLALPCRHLYRCDAAAPPAHRV